MNVKYSVTNRSRRNIYLVVDQEPIPGYELDSKELGISLEQLIGTDHYFDFPTLKKVLPGKTYHGQTQLDLDFLESNFRAGKWYLSLSVGYLDAAGMSEMQKLLKRVAAEILYSDFQRLQKILEAGAIRIELIE